MRKNLRKRLYALVALSLLLQGCEKEITHFTIMNPWIPYGNMSDQDGNTYKTILIGNQTWMTENLKTTTYNDGTLIPVVTDPTTWAGITSPACCWQNNDPARKVTYGVLYNWYTINTGKLCPAGWHVATEEDWTTLITYLGGDNIAGGKLKESGYLHWATPNIGATNEVAFRALPGGERRGNDALFNNLGEMGIWWTTSSNDGKGVSRAMYVNDIIVSRQYNSKQNGLSVRCIWNY
jgi:uncharacterized protein (TIGR02145 family)